MKKPTSKPINVHLLPKLLRQLIRVMGQDAALQLVDQFGGTQLVVPKRFTPDHMLVDVVGLEAFGALVSQYGTEVLELPKNDAVVMQLRHHRVRELREQGLTHSEIAIKTRYTRRWVIAILGSEEEELRQLGLFDEDDDDAVKSSLANSRGGAGESAGLAHDPFGLVRVTLP